MPKWKKCSNCGKHIPENWNRHEKCGWNIAKVEEKELKQDSTASELEKAIDDAMVIYRNIKQKYPEEYPQLDFTKIALTLFIQRRREK